VLLPSVRLLQEHITRHAADTILTHRATRGFGGGYRALGDRRAYHRSGAGVGCLAGSNAGRRGHTGWKLSFSTRHERCLVGVIFVDFGMYAACPRRFGRDGSRMVPKEPLQSGQAAKVNPKIFS